MVLVEMAALAMRVPLSPMPRPLDVIVDVIQLKADHEVVGVGTKLHIAFVPNDFFLGDWAIENFIRQPMD